MAAEYGGSHLNFSTWRLRQRNCHKSEAKLGYKILSLLGLQSKTLFQNKSKDSLFQTNNMITQKKGNGKK